MEVYLSDAGDFLPRVIIQSNRKKGSLAVNFRMVLTGYNDVPPPLKMLFTLFEDWTSFCIASIEHMPYMSEAGHYITDQNINGEVLDFLKGAAISHEVISEGDEGDDGGYQKYSFIIHDEDVAYVAAKLSTTSHMIRAATSIQRANISALVAEFEYMITRLLKVVCTHFPEKMVPDSATVNVGYLRSGRSFGDWQADQIEGAISLKLHESVEDIVKWILRDIANLKDISKVEDSPYFVDFVEVCLRRNLFVHNGGVVNQFHIDRCRKSGIPAEKTGKIGDSLPVNSEYLKSAAARVYLVGAFTISLVMQKLFSEHRSLAFKSLLSASHSFLEADMTKMAERIIDFAETEEKKFDHDLRLKFGINRALSKLFEPGIERSVQTANAQRVLKKYDWTVTNPIFDLALACIRREFENIIPLAQRARDFGLNYRDARGFAVFREAREIDGFMACFPKTPLMISKD